MMRSFSYLLFAGCCLIQFGFSATVKEVSIPSKALARDMKASVVLPDSYGDEGGKTGARYPVMYVLHGHGGNHTDWVSRGKVDLLADEHQMIIVCPNGLDSWYFDSYTNPSLKMESHIVRELVPLMDDTYRTVPNRKARAITGNSMGGHGALYLGAKHPELFGALGSMSGGVDFTPFPGNWNIKDNLGDYEKNKERWKTHTALYLLPKMSKGLYSIIISCGSEDFFFGVNRNLDEALNKSGIKHEFLISPGAHNWPYWSEAIKGHSKFFADFFNKTRQGNTAVKEASK